ncbi:MAG TPA: ABC transporter ATP-binding protein [Chloroflexi bacterium]|nr:ABC transporter ATP-binding protein [Chloroflexota bacterium]
MSAILQTENLTKRYGRGRQSRLALDSLTFHVEEGDIFGFVGPNGAGKTTVIRILATLLKPTAGEAWVGGYSIRSDTRAARRMLGYMPDFFGVYGELTVREYLDFFAGCYYIPPRERPPLIADLLELVDLGHRRDDDVDSLSRGMKQRLSLARTLIHDPQVLILDEPASGLDPRARVEIRDLLVELARMGKTVFFSTHILADVAEICTRIAIIEAGKLIAQDTLSALGLQQETPQRAITLEVLGEPAEAERILLSIPALRDVQPSPENDLPPERSRWQATFSGDDRALSALLSDLVTAGLPVVHFSEQQTSLEEIFMQLTQGIVS